MIIVKLKGGLGNQMFQYAFGRRIALENNVDFLIDISEFKNDNVYKREYSLSCFVLIENFATEKDLKKTKKIIGKNYVSKLIRFANKFKPYYKSYLVYDRSPQKYDSLLFKNKYKNVYFDGYWQNEKYFKDIEYIIRKDFTFRKNKKNRDNLKVSEMIKTTNSVALHIRNYGLTYDEKASKRDVEDVGIMKISYYKDTLKYLENALNNFRLFIFSDDINWVRDNYNLNYNNIIYVDNVGKDYEQMRLMSLCKHQIISNSTFSWWAAWLNNNPDKIVIAPKQWFRNRDTSDLIPKRWIIL
ncbi:alpha-1,2-fucosyltransferase [Bacteroidota bacterium]